MVKWEIRFKKTAKKDAERLASAGLKDKAQVLLAFIAEDPLKTPPPCEKLLGDLAGFFSRRINLKHRLVYKLVPEARQIEVFRMWSHYGD
jgi:toxin YoeB